MKKISILIPNLEIGGAERVAINLANGFVDKGYSVDIVLMEHKGLLLKELNSCVKVFNLNSKRIRNIFIPLIIYIFRSRPNCLLVSMWPLTVISILIKIIFQFKMKIIVSEHTTWSKSFLYSNLVTRFFLIKTISYLFPKADGVIAVSRGVAKDIESIIKKKIIKMHVIYNPIVDLNYLKINPYGITFSEWNYGNHYKILAVGTLKKVKDYPTLIQAIELVSRKINVKLLILGEGRKSIELMIANLNLEKNIYLMGAVTNPRPYYEISDLFVLSSRYEGFGNVLVEALSFGIPVVSTDCDYGPREILENGRYGDLVPVNSYIELASGIIKSLSSIHNKDLLIQRASYFSIDRSVNEYLKVILT